MQPPDFLAGFLDVVGFSPEVACLCFLAILTNSVKHSIEDVDQKMKDYDRHV